MRRVLFVCTGNTCRSPMAEAILKSRELRGIEVKSAGVFAANGGQASAHAKQVLEEQGINHVHTSSALTAELVEWADVILTMTSGHKWNVVSMFEGAESKTFTLTEFAGEQGGEIPDPFGGSLEIYRQTFNELKKHIEKIIIKIEK
ncbi:low molecular weight protein arginine phosphatase [Bacillus infantis]|uniref:low molecular weight protein arginine phosphatase n=1 Tax=Bacillus infantis TaxID=324767 RepID=UPI00215521F6|nr:low molecular weight protein arginine phosphatase [Bacillus infantis]MCR6613068.1 low molecular weight protein arginine phosphatase [Bacillus infantis]